MSVYLFFLNIVADAQAYDYPSPVYACEDVNNYYANVGNLEGKSLKKKLNSIIGKHQSLSYREVINIFTADPMFRGVCVSSGDLFQYV